MFVKVFITDDIKKSDVFQDNVTVLRDEFSNLAELLTKYSIPFFSRRYASHMCFETSMPAILGYFVTMLFNPNNVSRLACLLNVLRAQFGCCSSPVGRVRDEPAH